LTSLSAIIFITSLADVIDFSPRSKWKMQCGAPALGPAQRAY